MKKRIVSRSVRCLAVLLAPLVILAGSAHAAGKAGSKEQTLPPSVIPKPAPPSVVLAPTLPTYPFEEIRRGQKGYGLSVFAGSEPERFDVEFVGLMRNQTPDTSYILARLSGQGLEKSGVPNGMSGSPVFVDGRLVGAVAFSWAFANDALCGITPIETMRKLSTVKGGLPIGLPQPPVPLADLRAGRIPADLLERELARLRPQMGNGASASVQWTTSGFGPMSQGLLRQALGSVGTSGQALPDAGDGGPRDLQRGGAVAAVLVDGDYRLAATGTVTDRYGDQVLAFGHPFLGIGPIEVPMAKAEVVTVMSSQNSSFKISNLGEIVGAFEQDRQAGIQGRIGLEAPMIPMTLRIAAAGTGQPRQFNLRLADVPFYTPLLIGSSLLAGLDSASYANGSQGIDLTAHLKLDGHDDLIVRQSFDSDSAASESAAYLLSIVSYLVQNPLEKVKIRSVDLDVHQAPLPRAANLVAAHADRTVVRPGDRVNVSLDLVPYRGERFRHSVKVDLPDDLPAGRYSLVVADGATADATRLALAPADPVTFEQALDLLGSFHSRRELVVLGVYGGAGLSVAGEVLPRLPASVRSLWGAAASGSAVPLRSTIAQEQSEPMNIPLDGGVRIDLEVRRREPFKADGTPAAPEKAAGIQGRENRP
ncbi:MAG TPA: SpoIVB peptidase S55 domain-containing protein [Thermoanaerobaculia bacterium]|jgi:hypothetical protein|nr:SpoIVB peptidase S55 domain-containing protein [Thermoanaerobaculia bacterium]